MEWTNVSLCLSTLHPQLWTLKRNYSLPSRKTIMPVNCIWQVEVSPLISECSVLFSPPCLTSTVLFNGGKVCVWVNIFNMLIMELKLCCRKCWQLILLFLRVSQWGRSTFCAVSCCKNKATDKCRSHFTIRIFILCWPGRIFRESYRAGFGEKSSGCCGEQGNDNLLLSQNLQVMNIIQLKSWFYIFLNTNLLWSW